VSARVTIVVGARPNFMKAAPVARALTDAGAHVRIIHTGQHYDPEMSDVFVRQLGLPARARTAPRPRAPSRGSKPTC